MTIIPYQDYLDGTAKVLQESQTETERYEVEVLGREFIVNPGVFSPKYFEDTAFFAAEVPKLVKPKDGFLEIGSGTGIVLVHTALSGVNKGIGIDISHGAYLNTLANIRKHGLQKKVTVRHGDLYDPLSADEKFDVIFWNTPFGFVDRYNLTVFEKAVFDPGYQATERYIIQGRNHLKPYGRLLIGFSTTLGRFDLLQKFLQQSDFTVRLAAKTASMETHPVFFELFEATPLT